MLLGVCELRVHDIQRRRQLKTLKPFTQRLVTTHNYNVNGKNMLVISEPRFRAFSPSASPATPPSPSPNNRGMLTLDTAPSKPPASDQIITQLTATVSQV